MMRKEKFTLGVDFGTDSVRAILLSTLDGREIASSVFAYPRWQEGKYCQPEKSIYRQHPLDYLEGLTHTIRTCVSSLTPSMRAQVCGISIDTTGSTPIAVDQRGVPLSMMEGFQDHPNALFVLWKDHSAKKEALEINAHHRRYEKDYLKYVGGIYSAEWYWAKLLHVLREDEKVRKAIYTWVEHCDWIPFVLTGGKDITELKRSVCAAGHKALWSAEFGGYPPNAFFASLDPLLDGFVDRLPKQTYHAAQAAGFLCAEWAERLGLHTQVVIGMGAFDCHMGAVGGQIQPHYLSKVVGTSTCDIAVVPIEQMEGRLVKGICGQVEGSVIPGMVGLEAGQSAFGDAYAWLRKLLDWPLKELLPHVPGLSQDTIQQIRQYAEGNMLQRLAEAASQLPISEEDEWAIDWLNGRRTPNANQLLKGAFLDFHMGTDAPRMFRALVLSTIFGSKAIHDCFLQQGIPIKGIIALGGIPKKAPFIMQMMADVLGLPIQIHASEQTCAIGAAMFAATVAGEFSQIEDAIQTMGQGFEKTYVPQLHHKEVYQKLYHKYQQTGGFLEQLTLLP
jgi:L-ribulokinase